MPINAGTTGPKPQGPMVGFVLYFPKKASLVVGWLTKPFFPAVFSKAA